MLLPGFGEADLPPVVRAGIAVALAAVLLPVIAPLLPANTPDLPTYAKTIIAEIITGLWLGWLARVIVLALPIAGQIISYMSGLSSVLQLDAETGPGTTVLARLFSLLIPVAVLNSGLYALPVTALVGSYQLIPPGYLVPAQLGAEQAIIEAASAFALALRLASPFLIASVAWYTAVALLSRLTPRLQIYFVAAPAQILGAVALFAALSGIIITVWQNMVATDFASLPGLH